MISVELPDKDDYPEIFDIIKTQFIPESCGVINPEQSSMQDKKCVEIYWKNYLQEALTHNNGDDVFYKVKLKHGGKFKTFIIQREEKTWHHQWVVPFIKYSWYSFMWIIMKSIQ